MLVILVRSDRVRRACYLRSNICFNMKTCPSSNMENIFIDLFFPETKPISICKSLNQIRFSEQTIAEFEWLDLMVNTIFLNIVI